MQPQFVAAFESTSNSPASDSDNECHLQTYVHVITIDSTISILMQVEFPMLACLRTTFVSISIAS